MKIDSLASWLAVSRNMKLERKAGTNLMLIILKTVAKLKKKKKVCVDSFLPLLAKFYEKDILGLEVAHL